MPIRHGAVVAGANPHNRRYSIVVYAGLSASSTWHCVDALPIANRAIELLLLPSGKRSRAMCLRPSEKLQLEPVALAEKSAEARD